VKKLIIALSITIVLIGLCAFGYIFRIYIDKNGWTNIGLAIGAVNINADCPKMISENVRLDKAVAGNMDLSIYFTLIDMSDDSASEFKEAMKDAILKSLLNDKDTRDQMGNGVILR
jgi:hypothetical protein